ncbi:MAG: BON domain-containing protein [Bacteroidota bacterium]
MKKIISSALIVSVLFFASCSGPKDPEINQSVTTDVQAVTPGITTDVKDGVVTLTGQVKDETTRTAAEDAAKKVSGVKSVVNNITVVAPTPEPVVTLSTDATLQNAVNDLIKEYPDVTGKVTDGEIVINGEITKAGWAKLKPALEALNPRRLNSEILHIK